MYIADGNNNRIRKVAVSTGIITTFAGTGSGSYGGDGGAATSAALNVPEGVAIDSSGTPFQCICFLHFHCYCILDNVFIVDTENHRIRKVATGIITTLAGTGVGSFSGDGGLAISATLNFPFDAAVDSSGLLLTCTCCSLISHILTIGNVYIADRSNNCIRKVTAATGIITTIAGTSAASYSGDGDQATSATLSKPYGVAVDSSGIFCFILFISFC